MKLFLEITISAIACVFIIVCIVTLIDAMRFKAYFKPIGKTEKLKFELKRARQVEEWLNDDKISNLKKSVVGMSQKDLDDEFKDAEINN